MLTKQVEENLKTIEVANEAKEFLKAYTFARHRVRVTIDRRKISGTDLPLAISTNAERVYACSTSLAPSLQELHRQERCLASDAAANKCSSRGPATLPSPFACNPKSRTKWCCTTKSAKMREHVSEQTRARIIL